MEAPPKNPHTFHSPTTEHRRSGKFIEIKGCEEHNLKKVNVKFPKRPAQQRFVGIYTIIADRQGDL